MGLGPLRVNNADRLPGKTTKSPCNDSSRRTDEHRPLTRVDRFAVKNPNRFIPDRCFFRSLSNAFHYRPRAFVYTLRVQITTPTGARVSATLTIAATHSLARPLVISFRKCVDFSLAVLPRIVFDRRRITRRSRELRQTILAFIDAYHHRPIYGRRPIFVPSNVRYPRLFVVICFVVANFCRNFCCHGQKPYTYTGGRA